MANQVFANGMEIACKAGAGKVIAAFPDVCMTPPENPATPPGIPIPYPNTAMASDTTGGSKNVKISGDEIMLKNKSCFKTSTGDEAGCAAKKGVVSSKIKGKIYFIKWSMDVKVEGQNVDRTLDMTTNNHGSPTANEAVPWVFLDTSSQVAMDACKDNRDAEQAACGYDKESKTYAMKPLDECGDSDDCKKCKKARQCMLVPFGKPPPSSPNCCPGYTGDHLVEAASFANTRGGVPIKGCEKYNLADAPTCCAEGSVWTKDHGLLSAVRGSEALYCPTVSELSLSGGGVFTSKKDIHVTTYAKAKENGARSVRSVFTHCEEECIRAQLDAYDKQCEIRDDTNIRAITYSGMEKIIRRILKLIGE